VNSKIEFNSLAHDILVAFYRHGIKATLDYDEDYGIYHRNGWTFTIEGFSPPNEMQFMQTADLAIFAAGAYYLDRVKAFGGKVQEEVNTCLKCNHIHLNKAFPEIDLFEPVCGVETGVNMVCVCNNPQ
jgi:hypothetical protein